MRLLRALNNMPLDSVDMPSSHEPVASSVYVYVYVCVFIKEREKHETLLKGLSYSYALYLLIQEQAVLTDLVML